MTERIVELIQTAELFPYSFARYFIDKLYIAGLLARRDYSRLLSIIDQQVAQGDETFSNISRHDFAHEIFMLGLISRKSFLELTELLSEAQNQSDIGREEEIVDV